MYTIGQIANFLGMSRDTLKFYEEKGLVSPMQAKENGYRYYNDFDVCDVITTNFYRELDLEIKKIQEIREDKDVSEVKNLLLQKHSEVEAEINYKQQLLKKLERVRQGCEDIKAYLGKYTIREMKPLVVRGELSSTLAYEEYDVLKEHLETLKPVITLSEIRQIIYLKDNKPQSMRCVVVHEAKEEEDLQGEVLAHPKCIYTIAEEGRGTGSIEDITPAMERFFMKVAAKTGYESLGMIYINILLTTYKDGLEKRYLEIYAPIKEKNE